MITTLIDKFEDKRLNAPNDAVVHPDGECGSQIPIWVTWTL